MKKVSIIMLLCWAMLSSTAYASTAHSGLREQVWKQEPCMAWIIDHENRAWNPTIKGIGTSYGLPMSDPGEKMSSAGSDWRTNPATQLRWMRSYIKGRYGTSCKAKAFWARHSWY